MARISLMLFIALGLSGCYDAPSDCSRLADLRIEAPGAGPTITHALTAFDVATMLEQLRHQVDSVERAIPKPERP